MTTAAAAATPAKPKAKPAAAKPAPTEVEDAVSTAPVAEAAKVIEQAVNAGKDAVEQVVKASQDAAAHSYDKAITVAKGQVEAVQKVHSQAVKSSEEALAAARENLEAVVKASQLLAHGLQNLSKSVVEVTQEAVEGSLASARQLLSVRTLREAVDIQSAHAKAQIDLLLSKGLRLSDEARKVFEDALAPVQARVDATLEKLSNLNRH